MSELRSLREPESRGYYSGGGGSHQNGAKPLSDELSAIVRLFASDAVATPHQKAEDEARRQGEERRREEEARAQQAAEEARRKKAAFRRKVSICSAIVVMTAIAAAGALAWKPWLAPMFVSRAQAAPDDAETAPGATTLLETSASRPATLNPATTPSDLGQADSPAADSAGTTDAADVTRTQARVWETSDGRQAEAKFIGYQNGQVGLAPEDGREYWMPLDRLSTGDRRYLISQLAADLSLDPGQGLSMRTWSDASGNHQTTAAFVTLEGDAASLIKPDGTIIAVPLTRLSRADQEYLEAASPTQP